ncbi:acyl-[acyl-carrier-protein] thioesterase [Rubrivirga marina]|uniref:Acyl-ACP thioesterase n=1 Tax=Rubrivirga marina TaxID=1196024 RepID=A0A271J2T8_9BACT|nr:acyl-ACP thioesterase domain-containing protein [Rubrivirga marina]PAP77831.1 hypothetical protein BSZ37_15970 [Rubrivirga marina]
MAGTPEVWRQSFAVRAYEVGPDERASVLTVADYFQEAAGEHARSGGVETFDLGESTGTWVLHRLRLRFDGLPHMRQSVEVETWPSGRDRLKAYRDYRLWNEDREALAVGTSAWFVIDVERRRPVRLPAGLERFGPAEPEDALSFDRPPEAPEAAEHARTFHVRRSDLDRVGHANNVRFLEWALEALPSSEGLREIEVLYQSEAVYGDDVVSEAGPLVEGARAHRLARGSDNRTFALARTRWTP